MDLSADCGTLPTHSSAGGSVLEQELSLSSTRCQTESGGTILLQLLEFKTYLLEAVEELHIRRVAETRFEDQISKLMLEKQELEWEKESLQHQSETVVKQHTESLINVKKQFQAKIRNIEEEKGKYQVSADLKEKEINNLKEELKLLQLLKYNLEKKSSELEQKLALQSRSKDSHLNQLGEVERRFSALSKQCAMVKQAHEKLEENVDEAMKRNMKLTSAIEKQEAIIVSLKKELEEVNKQLIKAKMSAVRHNKSQSPTGREQHIEQLQHKLNMETEMNKKLREENAALRREKQDVVKSLQHAQQLLLSQTQTVSRVELELQTQGEQYQALKQEHEVMREKSKATEDKVAQLMESYTASKTSWDKEKAMFLDRIRSEQQGLRAVNKANDELHQKHTEVSSQASVQAQHVYDLERRDISQSLSVSTQRFPILVEEIRREEALNVPVCSSEAPGLGSLQHLVSTETDEPDSLEDTGAVTELVATAATGGQDTPNHHQQSQFKQPLNPVNLFTCPFTNNLDSLCLSGTTGSDSSISNKHGNNSNTSETDSDEVSGSIHATSSLSDNGLLISKGHCVRDTPAASSPDQRSVDGKSDEGDGDMSEKGDVKRGKSNREDERRNEEQPCDREFQGKEAKEGGGAGAKRGTLMARAADRADREDSQRSGQDAGDTKQPETESKDSAEGDGPDGVEERGTTGPHTPETQRPTQTTTDTATEKSNTQQVIDLRHTEPPLAACEPSDCSQTDREKVADSSLVSKGYEIRREVHTLCHDEAQNSAHQISEKIMEEKPSDKSAPSIPTELSGPLNQSSICNSQTNNAAQSDNIVCIQETTATQTPPGNPSDMKQTDEMRDTHVRVEPQASPQSQGIPGQQRGQLRSLIPDDEGDDSSACKKAEGQSNVDTCENNETVEKSLLKDVTVDTVESESETSSYQENMKNDKVEDEGDAETTKTENSSLENDNGALPETSSTKCYAQSPAKEMPLEDTNKLMSNKTYRPSFDWASSVGSRAKTDVSALHHSVQRSAVFEQNTRGPVGLLGQPSSTISVFLKSKQNKVPLVVTRASDLLNASGFSGTAASSRRHQQGEWTDMGETATADMESRASLSVTSFPVCTSSITVSRQSWQTTPGCSRAPTSAAGLSSEPDRELHCSQEREEQQSSFRAHISKIEQFLNTERLRLPKRRRMDN